MESRGRPGERLEGTGRLKMTRRGGPLAILGALGLLALPLASMAVHQSTLTNCLEERTYLRLLQNRFHEGVPGSPGKSQKEDQEDRER